MPLYTQYTTDNCRLATWEVTEQLEELMAYLPDAGACYQAALSAFKSDVRKVEWLAVRVLLYFMTGKLIDVGYYPNGKPFLPEGFISISHTKGYVAVILSTSGEVGIDIEQVSDRVCKVAHKFVRDDESLLCGTLAPSLSLLLIWSAKETIFKCLNVEGVDFRDHLHVDLSNMTADTFPAYSFYPQKQVSFVINYILGEKFVMTWTKILF